MYIYDANSYIYTHISHANNKKRNSDYLNIKQNEL